MALPVLASAQQNPETLSPVTVEATSESAVTEGSGSFITRETSTATPLSLSPRETPQSVSVVTHQRIQDQRLQTITDVVNNTTGVSVNQYETNRASFVSRGFEINTLMFDGVPTTWEQPWSSGEVFTSLAMFDRVELVRGATGLTTGAGDPSGAINLVRKRANSSVFTGNVELEAGSWNQRRGLVDLSTALNEAKALRARIVAEATDQDSYIQNLTRKNETLFATFEADLSPNTLLTAGFSYQNDKAHGPMWGGLPVWYSNGAFTDWDVSKTSAAPWTSWDTRYQTYFASLEHRFANDWNLRMSYTHGERKADSYLLYSYGAPDIVTGQGMSALPGSYKVKTKQDDFGIRLDGSFDLLGRKHEAAFGFVSSRQDFGAQDRQATPAFGDISNFNVWGGTAYPAPLWGPLSYYGKSKTDQDAIYGTARFHVSDPLKLIVGARVTNYEKRGDDIYTNPFTLKYNEEITPYIGATYDLSKQLTAYASYTDIFLPQNARDITGSYIEPIKGESYELGLKGEFLDRRLNASGAVFHIKQKNLAVATTDTIVGIGGLPETAYRASDGATSEGFEFELSGQLAPDWNLTAGYTQFTLRDADGQDVNTIYPRKLLRLFTTYRLPGALNKLTVGGGVSWQGKTYTNAINPLGILQTIEQGAYGLVNLMARYDFTEKLSLQLNINNVTDRKFYGMFDAYSQITYGAPRNATLTMRYRF
ncbi:TonB-dependent siderophore receptor [Variovorax sp. Sphag1AA]|uniref:TonB-dependent siderophore receptor n=1 Tax=Variovorax sp. Sphag1AA TaxID=2587027 RepID=UPI0018196A77|nr:TonB-dependent siderophore receptor [Variovorax sp. Sphag1AA]MBB3182064.1 outer membrane receptor for ferric coprogen and ferric-rhodotorulic acid [Variovorax sp. Sphag1AA]